MDVSIAVVVFLLTIFGSISFNGMLRNIAREKKWLIDIPNKSRKFHHRPTPLTGGIAIQLSMILGFLSLLFLADVKLEKEVFDLFSNNAETIDRTVYKKSLRLEESDQQTVFDLLVFENENDVLSFFIASSTYITSDEGLGAVTSPVTGMNDSPSASIQIYKVN